MTFGHSFQCVCRPRECIDTIFSHTIWSSRHYVVLVSCCTISCEDGFEQNRVIASYWKLSVLYSVKMLVKFSSMQMSLRLHHSLFGKMYFNEKNPTNYKYLKSEQNILFKGICNLFDDHSYLDECNVLCFKVILFINIF